MNKHSSQPYIAHANSESSKTIALILLMLLSLLSFPTQSAEFSKVSNLKEIESVELKGSKYLSPEPCKYSIPVHSESLLKTQATLKTAMISQGSQLCLIDPATASSSNHRFFSAATGTQIFGGDGHYPVSDMSYLFAQDVQVINAGETAVFDVEVDWGQRDTSLLVAVERQTHRANLLISDNAPTFMSINGSHRFQMTVESFGFTTPGEYRIKVMGLAGPSSNYLEPQYVTLQVRENAAGDDHSVNVGAQVAYSQTTLNTNGASVTQAFQGLWNSNTVNAYYDANSNGRLDEVSSPSHSVYPVHVNGFGDLQFGSGYAAGANLVVIANFQNRHFVAIHFLIAGNTVTPVLALAGDPDMNLILIQDRELVDYEITGEFGENGYVTGSIGFDPIYYDGLVNNTTFANHVEFNFTSLIANQ